jgi:hypothetical protein
VELEATLWNLAQDLRISPIPVGTTILDYSFIVTLYYLAIKEAAFQTIAPLVLAILERQDLESVIEYFEEAQTAIAPGNPDAIFGIKGSDTIPRYTELAGVMPDIEYMAQTSRLFWGITPAYATLVAQWPFEAKERYTGDFNVKTRNPILFVGNTWDAATPAASARNMSASFEGSVMFEQHGFGVSYPNFASKTRRTGDKD